MGEVKKDYRILKAEDEGRTAAYNYIVARKKYPLAVRPSNPFPAYTGQGLEEWLHISWENAFNETLRKHQL